MDEFHLCPGEARLNHHPHCRSTPKYNQIRLRGAVPVAEVVLELVLAQSAVMMSNQKSHQFEASMESHADPVS